MATGEALKSLGQANPAANTLTTLYTVPAAAMACVSTVLVCNQGTTPTTFRLSLAVAGAADTPKQYLYFDAVVLGKDTFAATIGLTMATTDVLRCYAGSAQVSFNASGSEIT